MKKKIAVACISFFVSISFVEILCRLFFESHARQIFQEARGAEKLYFENVLPSKRGNTAIDGVGLSKVPHPYFGYTIPHNSKEDYLPMHIEPGGFESKSVFYRKRKKNALVIGFIGASVADGLAQFEHAHSYIRDALVKRHPKLKSLSIEIINLAVPGYHQPQQLFLSTLYNQAVDMVISLEGSNELTLPPDSAFPIYYPMGSLSRLYYMKSYKSFSRLIKIKRLLDQRELFANIVEKNSSSLMRTAAYIFLRRINGSLFHLENSSVGDAGFLSWNGEVSDYTKRIKDRIDFFLKMVSYQKLIYSHEKIPAFFFLQPLAYLPQSKRFTKEESFKEEIFANNGQRKIVIEHIEDLRKSIKKSNLNLIDLTQIYLKTDETVYIDSCCHLNSRGYFILSQEIARIISGDEEKMRMFYKRLDL